MRYYPFLFLFVGSFIGCSTAPFTVPYRYPTHNEVTYDLNITFSSQPITEADIFIERGVLEYLVSNNFFKNKHLRQWNKLNRLTTLTPRQAINMMRLKRREANALRRFQRDNGLPQTGIIDTPVINIVFPITCGTPDYVDEPINDGFGYYDDIASNATGALKKKNQTHTQLSQ